MKPPIPSAAWIELFWQRVDRTGGADACWPLLTADGRLLSPNTVPVIRIPNFNKSIPAARAVWLMTHGELPDDLEIYRNSLCRHKQCCNPRHLRAGTTEVRKRINAVINPRFMAGRPIGIIEAGEPGEKRKPRRPRKEKNDVRAD